jgi:hypothetical protein
MIAYAEDNALLKDIQHLEQRLKDSRAANAAVLAVVQGCPTCAAQLGLARDSRPTVRQWKALQA